MSLVRRPQLTLGPKTVRKGPTSIVERSFVFSEDSFFRHFKGDELNLKVKFGEVATTLQVALHTDVNGEWEDIPFVADDQYIYSLKLKPDRCGTFRFKVKFSYNEGQFWYWDNVPYTTVLVDPPAMKGIRMYTMIPNVSGHLGDWMGLLDHIKSMGFNAIHVLPITELDDSESPYSAKELFQIDDAYRNPNDSRPVIEQWEDFVRKAKDLQIKICVDLVMNHIGASSFMAKYCPDWIATDKFEKDSLKRAGCWDNFKWVSWRDLVLIKYDHPNEKVRKEIWSYMKDYALFWANYSHYTGGLIRLDNLHSINVDFFEYLREEIKKEYPDLIIFAELFTDHDNIKKMTLNHSINLLLATPWFSPYAEQMRNFIKFLHENHGRISYFFPLNSHDSGTPAKEYGHVDATIPRYIICALFGMGMTGITQGVEYGAPEKIKFIGRQKKWHFYPDAWGKDFTSFFARIHQVLDSYPNIFMTGKNLIFIDNDHFAVLACYRYEEGNKKKGFILVSNIDTKNVYKFQGKISQELSFLNGRTFFDSFHNDLITVDKNQFAVVLKPMQFRIFEVTP